MSELDLVIRNGTVVTAADKINCDVGIKDGVVALMGKGLEAKEVIDASGKLVLPGGVDSHVHLAERPFYGVKSADDFESGSISAACGGTTTVIPFAEQIKGESLRAALDEYHEKATGKSVIDYAFHLMITDVNQQVLGQELPALAEDGYTSLKVYMTYDGMVLNDREILDVLSVARESGSLVMIHAENDHCIHWLTDKLNREGKTSLEHYPDMAPAAVEREATHRAITLGEVADVPVLIVHVSASDAADQIEWGQRRGIKVFGETCPQYLFLSEDNIRQPGWEGAKFMCAPIPRQKSNQDHLWRGLANGVFQVFSSDHCAFLFEGEDGKKAHGTPHFRHVAPGVPGIELRQALLFSEGVGKGRIGLHEFVALCSTNAAKLYGLYPRKGTIAVGADADIAIWDANREVTLSTAMLHDAMDYTPYEGMKVRGWPVTTLSRGEIVCHEGEMLATPGRGKFLRCEKSELARPLAS
jgi:dihydropyrimidinase